MTAKGLEARLKALEEEVTRLKDIEEIKRLQKIYGFYLERWQADDITELFSDAPDASVEIADTGVFIGKRSIRRFFSLLENPPKEFLHVMTQLNDVVDVDKSGKTAKGRWYGLGVLAMAVDGVTRAIFSNGVYENEYVKEDGKWKIKQMVWNRIFFTPYEDGWVKTPVLTGKVSSREVKPDKPGTSYRPYPSGTVAPFHFRHPITGK
jgi:hypothetical protein